MKKEQFKDNSSSKRFLKIVLIVLLAFLIIGIFYNWFQSQKPKSDEIRLSELNEQKKEYDSGILKASTSEWWIYITARTLIGLLLGFSNFLFYWYWNSPIDYNNQINFNEVLILAYSFIAFVIAGTPTKFVKIIRATIYNWRKREHVGAINIEEIKNEIAIIEGRIKKQKAA
jgi:hypothetical protein